MKQRKIAKILLCLGLTVLLVLSFAACKGQADEQDSQPPTATIAPTEAPTPTPTPPIPYTDVPSDTDYYDAVVWAYKQGIASDGPIFEPASTCTRGQVITFIWRAMGSPEPQTTENPISDILPADWYYTPALWAYENSISSNTTFNPGNPCTNAEAITFLWRAKGEPAAAVYNSSVSLANPGQYYTRAVAWADNGGMFAGKDSAIDPAAPCSRADLMVYLYWATEQWTFTDEDKTVQAEYVQIINDAQIFEVYGSGLLYADYVDVDGDGKVELLTVETPGDKSSYNDYKIIETVYANVDGHAGKYCEQSLDFSWRERGLSICVYDNRVYLRDEMLITGNGWYNDFCTIENGDFVVSDSVAEEFNNDAEGTFHYIGTGGEDISEAEYNAVMGKYTNQKLFLRYNSDGISVRDRGILPDPSAVMQKTYAAVLNGDFSAFEGTYKGQIVELDGTVSWVLDKNGLNGQKPFFITVMDGGAIHCDIEPGERLHGEGSIYQGKHPDTHNGRYYELYPIGISVSGYDHAIDLDKVRIHYINCDGGIMDGWLTKVS